MRIKGFLQRKNRVRAKISGDKDFPRLSVFRSNKFIYAKVIDDTTGKTLANASDVKMKKGTKSERAKAVGEAIGATCKTGKITQVVFDRNGFKYTGRIKLVADAARASGLKF